MCWEEAQKFVPWAKKKRSELKKVLIGLGCSNIDMCTNYFEVHCTFNHGEHKWHIFSEDYRGEC